MSADADYAAARDAWREAHLAPLWESKSAHKPGGDQRRSHLWPWQKVRPLLDAAMGLTSPAAVERRVLSLVNPFSGVPDDELTMGNIAVALQSLLPGETARPHRHSMNALRFVLEGSGVETLVNGKACPMEFGDMVLTPAWCWHEHHHRGNRPMIWLDVLDVPLHLHLGTAEFEPGPITDMPETIPDAAFAMPNLVPDHVADLPNYSPVFRYPYANAAAAVGAAPAGPDGARKVRYSNPMTGGPAIPFLDSALIQLDAGVETLPSMSNASTVCCVVEGQGETCVGEQVVSWRPRDIFTLPPGTWIRHRAGGVARLFVISDRDVLARLGLLRERIGNAPTAGGAR